MTTNSKCPGRFPGPLTAAACAVAVFGTVHADPAMEHGPFNGLDVVAEHQLAEMRGGIRLGGVELELGANVRTFADGVPLLETVIELAANGTLRKQVNIPSQLPAEAQPQVSGQSGLSAESASVPNNSTPAPSARPRIDLTGLEGADRVVVNDHKGFTAALHDVTRQRILSVLVNTANERALRHQVDVTVTVKNFREIQQSVRQALISRGIGRALAPQ